MGNLRFSRSARRHRIGKAHALHAIEHGQLTRIPADDDNDERLLWVGQDDRGIELEILAVNLPDVVLVIHVMPTEFRRK